jgi:DNA-binding NtrC family response regulator
MSATVIAMPAPGEPDLATLTEAVAQCGWTLEVARNFQEFRTNPRARDVVAVFLQKQAVGPDCSWAEAVKQVRGVSDEIRVVVCHGFGESIDWQEISEAGAFHALALPLSDNEVRQSIGFLWEADQRAEAEKTEKAEKATVTERRALHHAWPVRRHAGVRAVRQ